MKHPENCGICKYWLFFAISDSVQLGHCRRYPPCLPPPENLPDGKFRLYPHIGVYPMTNSGQWCGEYAELPDAPEMDE